MSGEEKKIMRIILKARDEETLAKLLQEFKIDVGGGGPRRSPDGTISMEAYVPEEMLESLKKTGVVYDIVEDATQVGKERQKEVGHGDRFEGGKKIPRGLGKKK